MKRNRGRQGKKYPGGNDKKNPSDEQPEKNPSEDDTQKSQQQEQQQQQKQQHEETKNREQTKKAPVKEQPHSSRQDSSSAKKSPKSWEAGACCSSILQDEAKKSASIEEKQRMKMPQKQKAIAKNMPKKELTAEFKDKQKLCAGFDSEYVNLYSKDDYVFIIKRHMAYVSEPLKTKLTVPVKTNEARFSDITSHVLLEVCRYFYYKVYFEEVDMRDHPPPYQFYPPSAALDILTAALNLEC